MQDITEFEIRLFNENSERISTTAGYEPFYILNKTEDLCFIQDDTKVQVHTITGQILCSVQACSQGGSGVQSNPPFDLSQPIILINPAYGPQMC